MRAVFGLVLTLALASAPSCVSGTAAEDLLVTAARSAAERGAEIHLHIVDLATGATLVERRPDALLIPASSQKLLTASAVLAALPLAAQLTTSIVHMPAAQPAGDTSPAEVVIIGAGDALLDADTTRQLARTAAGHLPSGLVTLSAAGGPFTGPDLGEGWMWDDGLEELRVLPLRLHGSTRADQPLDLLELVAAEFREKGHEVRISAAPRNVAGAPTGRILARFERPLTEALRAALQDSDNLVAECLLRLAGGTEQSASAGLACMRKLLNERGITAGKLRLADGSGVSRYNLTTARTLTALLRTEELQFPGRLRSFLPVSGRTGTLAKRFKNSAAEGRIVAKTGTLEGIGVLAGYMQDASGRELVFAMSVQAAVAPAAEIRTIMDTFLTGLVSAPGGVATLHAASQRL